MRWNIRAARDNSSILDPAQTPLSNLLQTRAGSSRGISTAWFPKEMICASTLPRSKPLLLMLQETNLDTNAFRFTAPKYSFIQHLANGPGKRGIALGLLAVLPAREIEGVPGTLILAKVPGH
ncbi:hypothetical protein BASA83_013508 [Batrachochytrium salamandrivorans]|nr:hypothetical protein BASA83_013508 [Batrachochytrium salamandrivorans]